MSEAAGAPSFAVILQRESHKPDAEIGRLLACHLDVHPTDAIVRVRYGGGLIVEDVSEEVAEHLVLRLRDIGVEARRIEAGSWGLMPRGYRAFGIELGDSVLLVRLVGGRKIEIPRADLFAIHVYGLLAPAERKDDEKQKDDAAGGGAASFASIGAGFSPDGPIAALEPDGQPVRSREAGELSPRGQKLHRSLVEAGAAGMEFHLALLSTSHGPVRVRKNDFDFGCLGLQRQAHSLDNYLILLEEILAYLPEAWNRKSAEQFLSDLDPKRILNFKEEEAWNLERWLYQWARIEADEHQARKEIP